MHTQVEFLDDEKNEYIYWIDEYAPVKNYTLHPGLRVRLLEVPGIDLTLRRVFISLSKLPPKHRIGTIAEVF